MRVGSFLINTLCLSIIVRDGCLLIVVGLLAGLTFCFVLRLFHRPRVEDFVLPPLWVAWSLEYFGKSNTLYPIEHRISNKLIKMRLVVFLH